MVKLGFFLVDYALWIIGLLDYVLLEYIVNSKRAIFYHRYGVTDAHKVKKYTKLDIFTLWVYLKCSFAVVN